MTQAGYSYRGAAVETSYSENVFQIAGAADE